jgi:hypothetical protein
MAEARSSQLFKIDLGEPLAIGRHHGGAVPNLSPAHLSKTAFFYLLNKELPYLASNIKHQLVPPQVEKVPDHQLLKASASAAQAHTGIQLSEIWQQDKIDTTSLVYKKKYYANRGPYLFLRRILGNPYYYPIYGKYKYVSYQLKIKSWYSINFQTGCRAFPLSWKEKERGWNGIRFNGLPKKKGGLINNLTVSTGLANRLSQQLSEKLSTSGQLPADCHNQIVNKNFPFQKLDILRDSDQPIKNCIDSILKVNTFPYLSSKLIKFFYKIDAGRETGSYNLKNGYNSVLCVKDWNFFHTYLSNCSYQARSTSEGDWFYKLI